MTEERKTIAHAGIAIFFVLVALLTSPRDVTPEDFLDRNEAFYPEFTDPNSATTLEVIDFDEETATARPFKVTFKNGKWAIPSHHDYPADGKDRLARTAAGLIEIKKDDYRSDSIGDHEALGVIDPLDESVSPLVKRGKRVTIKDENEGILADLIIGNELEGRSGLRFVRLPTQKRVYVSRMDLDISTQFKDWIERDLLQVDREKISRLILQDYSINERTGAVNRRDSLGLTKDGETWQALRMRSNQEVAPEKMDTLLRELDELSIVGVRPKPEGLSESLSQSKGGITISQADALSLRGAGYYFTNTGQLLSNEGELVAHDDEGVVYTLRFGEIVYGSGEAVTSGTNQSVGNPTGPGENRYLFITTNFDANVFPEPRLPLNKDFDTKSESDWTDADRSNKRLDEAHDEWQKKIDNGKERSDQLNNRFADWYYVISAESFGKIRLTRDDLIQAKGTAKDSS